MFLKGRRLLLIQKIRYLKQKPPEILHHIKSTKMKSTLKRSVVLAASLIMCLAVTTNAYSQKKKKAPKGSVKLEYNLPAGKPIGFSDASVMKMTMDFNGSIMETSTTSLLACTVTSAGKDGSNLKLEVRIDTLSQLMESPMGSIGGMLNEATGKSFTMTLSPAGKPVDVSDAEKVKFTFEGTESNVAQSFLEFFPVLPDKPVKPGDTWVTNDTLADKAGTTKMIVKADNKYEGMVKMDGIDCARITSTFTGTREMKSSAGGMDILISGAINGTEELFFAVKEGYYIKLTSNAKMAGNLDLSGAQSMSMPMAADIVTNKKFKK